MKTKWIILAICVIAMAIQAEKLVDYIPRSTGHLNARPADESTATTRVWNFSDTVVLVDGTGGDGSNERLYGGFMYEAENLTNPFLRIRAGFGLNSTVTGDIGSQHIRGVWLWNKADFLVEMDFVRFNQESSLSVRLQNFPAVDTEGRFVVKQGDLFYISSFDFGNGEDITLDDPGAGEWALLDTQGYTWDPNGFESRSFTDIQSVGLFLDLESSAQEQIVATVEYFQLFATSDLEPWSIEIKIPDAASAVISWPTQEGIAYTLQSRPDLGATTLWSNAISDIVGNGETLSITTAVVDAHSFYRVVAD